jgi:uncharacterized membrane protein
MTSPNLIKSRIQSIDVVRGMVMVIMALDHVRDYFHATAMTDDPLNLNTTTPLLFFTRLITHFCAPTFVFLSGTSAYLMSLRKTKKELSSFLIKRGLWLIFLELTLITLGWTFDPFYNMFILQVIWAIGISMVILGLLIHLPYKAILLIGLLIVFGHNILDYPEAARNGNVGFVWDLFNHGSFSAVYPLWAGHFIDVGYAFIPWLGIMLLGYCFGKLYSPGVDAGFRRQLLFRFGLCAILLFISIRMLDQYGDPHPWTVQRNVLYTFLGFLKVHKYPPSLDYVCMTLGPAMILLALLENVKNKFTDFFNIFGRVPMFYYILHLYLIHILCVIFFFVSGHTMAEAFAPKQIFGFRPDQYGYALWVVYAVWVFVILALYPLCKKYNAYKSTHKQWWLSYL